MDGFIQLLAKLDDQSRKGSKETSRQIGLEIKQGVIK